MSPIQHLHSETKTLPVKDHLSLISTQFLARALQPTHPSHPYVTSPPGPRSMKNTLQSLFLHQVQPYLVDGTLPPDTYRNTISSLHSEAVDRTMGSFAPSLVLGTEPTPVAVQELLLP